MQFLKSLSASALSCVLFAACAAPAAKTQEQRDGTGEPHKSAIRLNYHLYNRETVGLVRAFDDGQKVILQFVDLDDTTVQVFDDVGKEVTGVKRIGLYLVAPTLYRSLFVRVGNREAAVVRDSDEPDFVLGAHANTSPVTVAPKVSSQEKPASFQQALPVPSNSSQPIAANNPVAQSVPVAVTRLQQWEIKAGDSLRTTLEAWCERAGYRLVWNVDGGFRSQGGFVSEVDFKQAVKDLFAAIPQDLHLDVDVTKNKLVIVTGGGQ